MAPENEGSFAFNITNNSKQQRNITGFAKKDCQAINIYKNNT